MVAKNDQTQASERDSSTSNVFKGFEPFYANFINCPNQFLDICIVYRSRGLVRLVAYLIYKTYSWLDPFGMPLKTQFQLHWDDVIKTAGISRGSITAVIQEGIKYGYLEFDPDTRLISLRLDTSGEYLKTETDFCGFFVGKGHRTKLPESFFELVIPQQPLRVLKFVGTVFRFTVGYEATSGYRRSQHPLSIRFICKHANLSHRHAIEASRDAVANHFITLIKPGDSIHPAVYAPRWCVDSVSQIQSETANLISQVQKGNRQTCLPKAKASQFKKGTTSVQKGNLESPEKEPPQFKKGINKKKFSKTFFTDNSKDVVVPPELVEAVDLLLSVEFDGERLDRETALQIAKKRGFDVIKRQVEWLPQRKLDQNPLGGLRASIEQDWSAPSESPDAMRRRLNREHAAKEKEQLEAQLAKDAEVACAKQERRKCRQQVLPRWNVLSEEEKAEIEQAVSNSLPSQFDRRRFENNEEFHLDKCLDEMCRREGIASPITLVSQ